MEEIEEKSIVKDEVESGTISTPLVEISQRNDAMFKLQPLSYAKEPNSSFDDSSFVVFKNVKKKKKKNIQSKLTYAQQSAPEMKEESAVGNFEQQSKSNVEEESYLSEHCMPTSVSECEAASEGNGENLVKMSVCPLCWKQFERKENFSAHLKSCAVQHKLSLKQLMDALELQTKQTEERKSLGLPAVPQNMTAKKGTSRKGSSARNRDDPDLQLGLALSVSMKEAEEQKLLQEQDVLMEAGLGHEIITTQATLLERFGFTSSRPALSPVLPVSRHGKLKLKGVTPLLLLRSQEERERLITEKVAMILTAGENSATINEEQRHLLSYTRSERLHELYNKECALWNLAGLLPTDDDNLYYVQTFSNFVSPAKVKAGEKLQHLSQLPCRLTSPGRSYEETSISAPISAAATPKSPSQQSSKSPVRSSTFPGSFLRDLAHDWKRLLNEEKMSDVAVVVKGGRKINAHGLVFYVRCPAILSDVQEENGGERFLKSIFWSDVPYESAYAFLDFIYCGRVSKIMKLSSGFESVLMLADRYNLTDLQYHLRLVGRIREQRTVERAPTKDQELKENPLRDVSPDNSQSLLSPNCKSLKKHKRKLRPESDEKHISEDCSVTLSQYSSKCPSPDPFSDTNMELNEENNASTQQDMDHLMNLLGSSPSCNRKSCQRVLSSDSRCLIPSDTLSKEKRKQIEDKNSADEGDYLELKRRCVRSSLLEKFKQVSACSQPEDPLTIDLTQSSGKTSTSSSSQGSLSSPMRHGSSNEILPNPLIKEENCDVSNNIECERTDILGDFCADFEYNNYYYNYSPYKTFNKSSEEKSPSVGSRGKGTPKRVSLSPKMTANSITRSVSQNFLDDEIQYASPVLEKQRTDDCASSTALSPISVKCLSQDSIHLKSHNSPHMKGKKHDLAKDNSSYDLPETFLNSVSHGQTKKSSANHSLSSIKRMLEDSFVDELGSSTFWREKIDSTPNEEIRHCLTPKEIGASQRGCEETPHTHTQGRIRNDITPKPDYSGMKTPMLKRELHKYGLKPLKKRQAKLMLRHIYDELHPYAESGEAALFTKSDENQKSHLSQNGSDSPSKGTRDKSDENNDTSVSSSQGSSDEVGSTQTNPADVKVAVEELIKSNESLHKKVLLYEPVWLEELQSALKEKKYKFKLEQIIEYLDEQCITFRTEQKRPVKRRTKKKQ